MTAEAARTDSRKDPERAGTVLLISSACLQSTYIREHEVPVLLEHHRAKALTIIPVIVSPCLYDRARFKFPDPRSGPHEIALASLQAANQPDRALSTVGATEQDEVMLTVARHLLQR
jgi:hypothetical protein